LSGGASRKVSLIALHWICFPEDGAALTLACFAIAHGGDELVKDSTETVVSGGAML